jgi:hypothetical protein
MELDWQHCRALIDYFFKQLPSCFDFDFLLPPPVKLLEQGIGLG